MARPRAGFGVYDPDRADPDIQVLLNFANQVGVGRPMNLHGQIRGHVRESRRLAQLSESCGRVKRDIHSPQGVRIAVDQEAELAANHLAPMFALHQGAQRRSHRTRTALWRKLPGLLITSSPSSIS